MAARTLNSSARSATRSVSSNASTRITNTEDSKVGGAVRLITQMRPSVVAR